MKKIRLTDESLNKYGFRVLTGGLDMTEFKKNPIMFFGHQEWDLPIGKWEDIEVKSGEVYATPVFDENDEFALKVKGKYEQGMLNAASIGFRIMATSEDPAMMVKGQTRPTVTKSVLREASIVNIPANSNAYKLYFADGGVQLSAEMPETVLNSVLPKIHKPSMKAIALQLGLSEDSTEQQILAKLAEQKANKPETPKTSDAVEAVVALAESKGLSAEHIRKLAEVDASAALTFVKEYKAPAVEKGTKPALSAAEIVEAARKSTKAVVSGGQDKNESLSFGELRKKNPKLLEKMRLEDPEKYESLKEQWIEEQKAEHPAWF